MTNRVFLRIGSCAAILVSVVAATLVAMPSKARKLRTTAPALAKNFPQRPLSDLPVEFRPFREIMPRARTVGAALDTHRRLAAVLNAANLPDPPERLAHFRWIQDSKNIRLEGWAGYIENVEDVEGGVVVTIRMTPRITNGMPLGTSDCTYERCEIIDGRVRLIDVTSTKGPPDLIGG